MIKKIAISSLVLLPFMVFADNHGSNESGLSGLINTLNDLANNFYGLIITLIVVAFAWGVLKFVFQSGDDQETGKKMMIWSIVAITVLMSIWGIVALFQNTLNVDGTEGISAPKIPTVQ